MVKISERYRAAVDEFLKADGSLRKHAQKQQELGAVEPNLALELLTVSQDKSAKRQTARQALLELTEPAAEIARLAGEDSKPIYEMDECSGKNPVRCHYLRDELIALLRAAEFGISRQRTGQILGENEN